MERFSWLCETPFSQCSSGFEDGACLLYACRVSLNSNKTNSFLYLHFQYELLWKSDESIRGQCKVFAILRIVLAKSVDNIRQNMATSQECIFLGELHHNRRWQHLLYGHSSGQYLWLAASWVRQWSDGICIIHWDSCECENRKTHFWRATTHSG